MVTSRVVTLPWRISNGLIQRLIWPVLDPVLRALGKVLEFLFRLAVDSPLVSIPLVLIGNVLLIQSLSASGSVTMSVLSIASTHGWSVLGWAAQAVLELRATGGPR